MDPVLIGLFSIIFLFFLLALGLPIAFAMTGVGFGGLVFLMGIDNALNSLKVLPFSNILSYVLTVIPMFILMGQFAHHSGISHEILDVGRKWLSRLPGGLACTTVAGSAMFAACTGSSLATCATMGKIVIPDMEEAGYHRKLAAGCVAGSGTLGILIPPSIAAIIYAAASDESVASMLIAGIIPGLLSAVLYIALIVVWSKLSPNLAPPTYGFSWKERLVSLKGVWGILVIFFIVIGSIYLGWATPTEAGALGAFGTLLIALCRRRCTLKDLWHACCETVRTTAMIFAIFIGTTLFGYFISMTGIPMRIAEVAANLPLPPILIVIAMICIYVPLGLFLDTVSMILLTIPILYPVINQLGYNGVWFGVIVILMCELALITPPVAFNIYVVKGVANHIPVEDITRGIIPFYAIIVLIIAILIAFPQITLFLPNLMHS